MTGKRRLTKSLNTLDTIKQNNPIEFPGILGSQFKGQSLVEVPNRSGYVYVRLRSNLNEIVQAYNSMVSPVYGLPVIVVRDTTGNRYIVKGRDLGMYGNWGDSAYLPRHGAQHSFPEDNWGGDIVWVYDRQFVPLCVTPATGTTTGHAFINPDVYYWNGAWLYCGAVETVDLLPYKPTGSAAKLILVYMDSSGNPQTTAGIEFNGASYTTPNILPYLPAMPTNSIFPLGAVILYTGTTSVSWSNIYDLRPFIAGSYYTGSYGGGGGHVVKDEGVSLTQRSNINFIGANVAATDNAGTNSTDVTVSGVTSCSQTGTAVYNEDGNPNWDFRIESDAEQNMFFLDSSTGTVFIGGTTNGVKFLAGGEMSLLGTATVWEDLRVPMTSTKLGGTKDPHFTAFKTTGTSQGVFIYWFDAGTEEELYFACQIPHSYKVDSNIYPHVHWTPSVSGSASQIVSWGLEYTWASIGSIFGNTSIIYANAHDPADSILLGSKHYMTALPTINGSGKGISSMLICRIFRDATGAGATDSFTGDAGLIEIDFHYEMDTMGSKTELAK